MKRILMAGILTGWMSWSCPGVTLIGLGDLAGGETESVGTGVSDDGAVVGSSVSSNNVVAGTFEAFVWTVGSGMKGLGDLPGGSFDSAAYDISVDGSTVVGYASMATGRRPVRWARSSAILSLGTLPNTDARGGGGSAYAVSGDGSVVVGQSDRQDNEAFRWTAATGMHELIQRAGPSHSVHASGVGVSASGDVVVGMNYEPGKGWGAFRWTPAGGSSRLPELLGGQTFSVGNGVSSNGAVVVGTVANPFRTDAVRWLVGSTVTVRELGDLPGGLPHSQASAVSGDGTLIVGTSDTGLGAEGREAFLWREDKGMLRLWDVLVSNGIDPSKDGWTVLADASAVSASGRYIAGTGVRGGLREAFRVDLIGTEFHRALIRLSRTATGTLRLEAERGSGREMRLYQSSNLADWAPVPAVQIDCEGGCWTFEAQPGGSNLFFRLEPLPPPSN